MVLEVDSDSESNYASDGSLATSTDTLASSIYAYRYENGRRYHAYRSGQYPLPNDEKEQDRLDIFHHINSLMDNGKLHYAPLENPQRILDIGTGTGIWAIDAGELYPSAVVTGTDLSPIQPSWVPPNVTFQIDDAEQDWTWSAKFDYIHIRCMFGSIGNWPQLVEQAYKHLKPGGWLEIDEYPIEVFSDDDTLRETGGMRSFYGLLADAISLAGKFIDLSKLAPLLHDAGFTNVHEKELQLPVGMWPKNRKQKELGSYFLLQAESGFEAYGMALFTRVLEMPAEEAAKVVKGGLAECRDRKVHSYAKRFVYWAQKPVSD